MKYVALPNDVQHRLPFYLAMEEYVARHLAADDYFFMWQVEPTVIFGRNQLIDTEVDVEYCRANSIQTYRRKSGGGCVYADRDNLMLSYVTPASNVNITFNRDMLMVEHLLQKLGIDAIGVLYGYGDMEELSSYSNVFLAPTPEMLYNYLAE